MYRFIEELLSMNQVIGRTTEERSVHPPTVCT
jgi:hypothetical protein